MGRPATGKTPGRNIRVPDERWKQAKEKAEREGKTIAEVVNDCLEKYVGKDDGKKK
jgi:predicted DNA-binding protein